MKLAGNNGSTVIAGGIEESAQFTVHVDGKLFRILSNTLYQNKIGSMVREISCNAVDSHTQAGTPDLPFVIHVPNDIEPWFSVKDFGVGLTKDDVYRIFCCFNRSTKNESNDQVGAFGFGSKSPFAYTNSFTIISNYNGEKYIYTAVIKEDDTPTIYLMQEPEPTTDHNGIEVKVAVAPADFNTFRAEIAEQLKFFKVKPKLENGKIDFANEYEGVTEVIDNVHFRKYTSWQKPVTIVQGGVHYPLDLNEINKAVTKLPAVKQFIDRIVTNASPIFVFNIGEIEVTPNREAVSYSKATVENIIKKMESVSKKLNDLLAQKMDAFATQWERAVFLRHNQALYSRVIDYSNNRWKIETQSGEPRLSLPKAWVDPVSDDKGKYRNVLTAYSPEQTRSGNFRCNIVEVTGVVPQDKTVFVVDDGSTVAHGRIRRYVEENAAVVYFIRGAYQEVVNKAVIPNPVTKKDETKYFYGNELICEPTATAVADLKKEFDGAKFIQLSTLPKPEREKIIVDGVEKVKPRYVPASMYKLRAGMDVLVHGNFEKVFVKPEEMDDDATYVTIEGRNVTVALGQYNELFYALLKSGLYKKPIYAIRERDIPNLKDNPAWRSVHDEMAAIYPVIKDKYKRLLARYAVSRSLSVNLPVYISDDFMKELTRNAAKFNDPKLRKLLKAREKSGKFCNSVKGKQFDAIATILFKKELDGIYERYRIKNERLAKSVGNTYNVLTYFSENYWSKPNKVAAYSEVIGVLNFLYAGKNPLAKSVKV